VFPQRNFEPLNALAQKGGAGSPAEGLCFACGLCCNGVIFADVRLQAGDDAERLRSLGLPLTAGRPGRSQEADNSSRPIRFRQPCAAFDGCRCRIYADRPRYCREFECVLLKSVSAGHTGRDAALGIIASARRRADEVLSLLRQLGDRDEHLPVAARFRRTARRLEQQGLDEETAERYGRLTLAVHDLNLLLADAFYPGSGAGNRFAETSTTR
jgi:hypothetical protein